LRIQRRSHLGDADRSSTATEKEAPSMLGRLFRLVIVGSIASMIAAAVGAFSVKRRLTPTTDESADEITAVAIFAPLAFHSTAKAFRGGELECWYGGGVLDLRDAQLAPEGATLKVRAVFGGGQIIVPATWRVVTRVSGMGGIQDVREAKGYSAIDPELTIEGTLIAGGFAVTSELAEGEDQWLKTMKENQAGSATATTSEPIAATASEPMATTASEPMATATSEPTAEAVAEPEPGAEAEALAATESPSDTGPTEPATPDETDGQSEATEAYTATT
jgi:hypothetical protein